MPRFVSSSFDMQFMPTSRDTASACPHAAPLSKRRPGSIPTNSPTSGGRRRDDGWIAYSWVVPPVARPEEGSFPGRRLLLDETVAFGGAAGEGRTQAAFQRAAVARRAQEEDRGPLFRRPAADAEQTGRHRRRGREAGNRNLLAVVARARIARRATGEGCRRQRNRGDAANATRAAAPPSPTRRERGLFPRNRHDLPP